MTDEQLPNQDSTLVRWLAIASAAGAALSAGFSAFSSNSTWASIALVSALLATAGIASVSALSMMLAGLVPAVILTLCNLAAAYWVAVKRGYPVRPGGFAGWAAVITAFLASLPGLLVVLKLILAEMNLKVSALKLL